MQISLDSGTGFIIQAYSEQQIKINEQTYSSNTLITPQAIQTAWTENSLSSLTLDDMLAWLTSDTELVLIGHNTPKVHPPYPLIHALAKRRIGFECMAIGAACRTYTILNSEHRQFIAGFLFG